MDSILIGQKLEALRHCITRIVEKCPANVGLLAEDADLQDIVVLNLTRSVQLCVDIASHLIAASAESAPADHAPRIQASLLPRERPGVGGSRSTR